MDRLLEPEIQILLNLSKGKKKRIEIAKECNIPYTTLIYLLPRLEAEGLVKETREGKKIYVELTEKGKEKVNEIRSRLLKELGVSQ
ncbi:winged helix-turn-helix domain-containing protein [Sulfolobus acidocaldarius]|jgi:predicted transcriptional regulator|uniref:winged helix-turn-helix domain-containing protein n=1 Tax=Sulfolobus acidocaldarius TaxID=2285 RepID=UPI0007857D0C|nr:winged helix-turn-helix domain-containing protein [Sulfolobus acidocaldarius]